MDNLVLMERSREVESLGKELGFSRTFFLHEDVVLLESKSRKELLQRSRKGKLLLYRPPTEELLRFALEKSPIRLVVGQELLHEKDSLHYPRSGLDQVLCKIAAEKHKIICFSFAEILNSSNRPQLLARMMFNVKLCRKYKVRVFFSTFARDRWELRSAKDLQAFWRMLGGEKKSLVLG